MVTAPVAQHRILTTEERIAELRTERETASYGRVRDIDSELETLEVRLTYEKTGKVTL